MLLKIEQERKAKKRMKRIEIYLNDERNFII